MKTVLGKNCLFWCHNCNMAVISAKRCPRCGGEAKQVSLSQPWDVRPAFSESVALIRRLVDEKYGEGCGRDLIPDDRTVILNDNAGGGEGIEIILDGAVVGLMSYGYDLRWSIDLYAAGFRKIVPHLTRYRVFCNRSGAYFLRSHGGFPVSGMDRCDPGISSGDWVAFIGPDGALLGTGLMRIDDDESDPGAKRIGVKVKEHGVGRAYKGDAHTDWGQTVRWNSKMMEKMVKEAISFMRKIIKQNKNLPYGVSFSGGKDSQAVVMLCIDAKLHPTVMFADTGLEFPETVKFVKEYSKHHKLDLHVAEASFESFLRNMKTFGPPAEGYRWCCKTNKLSTIAILESEMYGKGSVQFIGQRRYESRNRMRNGRVSSNPWIANQITASPIQEWNAIHVWLYIMLRKEKYNPKYREGLPRIGCILCPFASLPEIVTSIGTSDKAKRWYQGIEDYGKSRGMPEEWTRFHLWRFRNLPPSEYNRVAPYCEKTREELMKRSLPPERPPMKVKIQEGFSPCILGYSIEAGLSRAVDLERLQRFACIMGKDLEYEPDSYLGIGNLTVYAEGAIVSKGDDLDLIRGDIRRVFEIIIKSEECCGCNQCSTRCPTGALTMVHEKVEIDPAKCVSCRKCLCPCPSVKYSDD